jgi:hypothetical protein
MVRVMSRGLSAPKSPALDLPKVHVQRADVLDPWILDPTITIFAQRLFRDASGFGDLG